MASTSNEDYYGVHSRTSAGWDGMAELERRGECVPPAPAAKLISISHTCLTYGLLVHGSMLMMRCFALYGVVTYGVLLRNYGSDAVYGVLDGMSILIHCTQN